MSLSSKDRRSDNLSCKVYIGGLGNGADSKEIESVFAPFGRVQSVWVARHPPGFAFVAFEDPRDADDAVRCLDGTKLNGKRVRVEKSSGESRWEKWNLSPPASSSLHGVTLDYKDIREAILIRKQLRSSRSSERRRHSSHSTSSTNHRSTHRRRSRSVVSASCSGSEVSRMAKHHKRRDKFTHERSSVNRSRSRSRNSRRRTKPRLSSNSKERRTARTRTRTRHHVRRSYDSSTSRSTSAHSHYSSGRCRTSKRSKSRSRSRSPRKVTTDGKTEVVLPKENDKVNGDGKEIEKTEKVEAAVNCSCASAVKPEMVTAQTQTDAICQQTVGIQCQRKPEPRRLPIKRVIKVAQVKLLPTSVESQITTNDCTKTNALS